MRGVGRIHIAVNVPAFTSFTATDNGDGTVNIAWVAVRTTSVVVKNSAGSTVGSGGASGSISNVNLGYGVTETFTGTASDSKGGVARAQATVLAAAGPAPVFTLLTGTAAARNITLTWIAINCSVVEAYLVSGGSFTLIDSEDNNDNFVYAAASYSTTYTFLMRAIGQAGAPNTDVYLTVATQALPQGTANYAYTGGAQTFVVPSGVYSVDVTMWGGKGNGAQGGIGGLVQTSLAVIPGETLDILVGGSGAHGGTYGGGGGGFVGGGGSFIQRSGAKLVVGGGGGGMGGPALVFQLGYPDQNYYADGGPGGGYNGGSIGVSYGGGAGTAYGPGYAGPAYHSTSPSVDGTDGAPGSGINGGAGSGIAGGGGGGYFGGGGGAAAPGVQVGNVVGGGGGGGGGASYGPVGYSSSPGSAPYSPNSSFPSYTFGDGYVQIRYGF